MEVIVSKPLIREWRCDQMRLTAFWRPNEGASIGQQLLWENVVGHAPDAQAGIPGAIASESGRLANGASLVKHVSLNRVDWILFPYPNPLWADPKELADNLPLADKLLNEFAWLLFDSVARAYGSALRIAFGMTALRPFATKELAYADLAVLLPDLKAHFTEGATDFLYQINRPRQSQKHSGIKLNRLSKWMSVVPLQPPVGGQPFPLSAKDSTMVASRTELDISTSADGSEPISTEVQRDLLPEMAGMVVELLEQGDVP